MLSTAEENYMKRIYELSEHGKLSVTTNALANNMATRPASVTDMVKKLAGKNLIVYTPYHGVALTRVGKSTALSIIRRHRLWEVFLVKKLGFTWDEVHEVAEQLEHVRSEKLIQALDEYLGSPKIDPHGDPIPDAKGRMEIVHTKSLLDCSHQEVITVTGVFKSSSDFLRQIDALGIKIGSLLYVNNKNSIDQYLEVIREDKCSVLISRDMAKHIAAI